MVETIVLDSIHKYNAFGGKNTLHPMVSVLDLAEAPPTKYKRLVMDVYCIMFKNTACGDLRYGKGHYDYQDGSLLFFAPGQTVTVEDDGEWHHPKGYCLVFHPDLLRGTSLNKGMHEHSFFNYQMHEALHLSIDEQKIILEAFAKIDIELRRPIDRHSKKLIVSDIEQLLTYCTRFYDRQFISRNDTHQGVLEKFEQLVNDYLLSGKGEILGLPSVNYFAGELCLSPNYFGDLVKRETGKSPQEYIQLKLIETAKEKIFDESKPLGQIASELGFKYSSHFTRSFKNKVGMTPLEYRNSN
ncbi:MAG: helix-turn-helix transcriptional regulator [Pedobacter sp.]